MNVQANMLGSSGVDQMLIGYPGDGVKLMAEEDEALLVLLIALLHYIQQ